MSSCFFLGKTKHNITMDKFDLIGEAVLAAILAAVFSIECIRLFFAGKAGWIVFLPLAWMTGSWVWDNIKALRR